MNKRNASNQWIRTRSGRTCRYTSASSVTKTISVRTGWSTTPSSCGGATWRVDARANLKLPPRRPIWTIPWRRRRRPHHHVALATAPASPALPAYPLLLVTHPSKQQQQPQQQPQQQQKQPQLESNFKFIDVGNLSFSWRNLELKMIEVHSPIRWTLWPRDPALVAVKQHLRSRDNVVAVHPSPAKSLVNWLYILELS